MVRHARERPVSPYFSVFMPSYNKRGFGVEAARSVLDQDFEDWELWVLENSTDGRTRSILRNFLPTDDPRIHFEVIDLDVEIRANYSPAAYLDNRWYPKANGEIILYISDDDLFMPGLFSSISSYFNNYPDREAVYFHLARTRAVRPGTGTTWGERFAGIPADLPRGAGEVDCQIDGGQVAYRKQVLNKIDSPYFPECNDGDAGHADGLHLEKITQAGIIFYPLPVAGVIHRHTLVSTWSQ